MLTTVNSAESLQTALRSAQSGDTIQLAQGDYNSVLLLNMRFDQTVTITSQNPQAEAVISGLTLRNVTGLTFKDIEFKVDANMVGEGVKVYDSANVHFDHVSVHGSMDGDATNDGTGLLLRGSTDVSVTNSEFQQLHYAIQHRDDSGVTISGNSFHDIRMDGIRGGGSSNVTITKNFFTDFYPQGQIGGTGDHADAIQFWTTNTTTAAHDITISDNTFVRGAGYVIQGVFMRDEVGGLAYENVAITNNVIIGGLYNGISVSDANGLQISGNQVVGLQDQMSGIRVDHATNAVVSNNTASSYSLTGSGVTEIGDKLAELATDGGKAILQQFLTNQTSVASTIVGTSSGLLSQLGAATTSVAADGLTLPSTFNLEAATAASVQAIATARAQLVTTVGTSGADKLTVNTARDTFIDAQGGNDMLTGGGIGHNTLSGGAGDDTYNVKSENDTVAELAGGGVDTVVAYVDYELTDNVENLRLMGDARYGAGNALANQIGGTAGDDELHGLGGNDAIQGGLGNDLLTGDGGDDSLTAGAGDDTVSGGIGVDRLYGNEGNDSLSGGAGADQIEGNAGSDTMSGGAGADIFQFRDGDIGVGAARDHIVDFSSLEGDKLGFSLMDANSLKAGNDAFAFIGTNPFHKVAGEMRYELAGKDLHLMGDINGDGAADFSVWLTGVNSLKSSDIFL